MTLQTLVTGGAGFIGSHLVERLLEDGHRVLVVDNLATGREENLAPVRDHPGLRLEKVAVQDFERLRLLMDGVDWVFHLAGLADIVPSIQKPMAYHSTNVDGTLSVLESARLAGVKRLVYVASSTCYGLPDVFPTPETAPIRPMFPYAVSKYMGEELVLNWHKIYGLPAVSLRFFNVFGPRSRTTGAYGAVFGVFLAQKLAGKPFTVVGDGTQTRDFTFVTDVVDAMVRAAESSVSGEVFNVGSGGTYSINSLVGHLGGEIAYVPKRPGEPDCTFADITKIRRVLQWEPSVTFEQGIEIMLDHIELWRSAPVWDRASVEEATRDWFKYLGR
jgi:UDP-glucose 4-epimerase